MNFAEIIPVSALKEMNIEDVKSSIFKYLPAGPQFYDEDTVTDQPMRQIAAELIREKALRMLDDEIPHGIAVVIETASSTWMQRSCASAIPTRASSSEKADRC